MQVPVNVAGERPTRGAAEAAERLREKMRALRGRTNRRLAEAEVRRVLREVRAA